MTIGKISSISTTHPNIKPALRNATRAIGYSAGMAILSPVFGGFVGPVLSLTSGYLIADGFKPRSNLGPETSDCSTKSLKYAAFASGLGLLLINTTQIALSFVLTALLLVGVARIRQAGQKGICAIA